MNGGLTVYTLYGLRLHDNTDPGLVAEDPGPCRNDGTVGYVRAGILGSHMTFLAIMCTHVKVGDYVFHSGEQPNASKFIRDQWNSDLRAVCDRLAYQAVEGPGWFTIPSED